MQRPSVAHARSVPLQLSLAARFPVIDWLWLIRDVPRCLALRPAMEHATSTKRAITSWPQSRPLAGFRNLKVSTSGPGSIILYWNCPPLPPSMNPPKKSAPIVSTIPLQ